MQYFQLPQITIGGYDYPSRDENGNPPPVKFVLRQYAKADFNATFNTYVVNATITQSKSKSFSCVESGGGMFVHLYLLVIVYAML